MIPLGGVNLFKDRLGEIIEEAEDLIDTPDNASSSPFMSGS